MAKFSINEKNSLFYNIYIYTQCDKKQIIAYSTYDKNQQQRQKQKKQKGKKKGEK